MTHLNTMRQPIPWNHSMPYMGVHFVNVTLVIQWNAMLLQLLQLHVVAIPWQDRTPSCPPKCYGGPIQVGSNIRETKFLLPTHITYHLGAWPRVGSKTNPFSWFPSPDVDAHNSTIIQGWNYFWCQRFRVCYVLKIAPQKGEGEKREECKFQNKPPRTFFIRNNSTPVHRLRSTKEGSRGDRAS